MIMTITSTDNISLRDVRRHTVGLLVVVRTLRQWRTEEEGLGGLEPLPLAYDLRNKRVRMRQNMVFSTKSTNFFSGEGHSPLPTPSREGDTPSPFSTLPRRLRHLDPSHSKILGTPLVL